VDRDLTERIFALLQTRGTSLQKLAKYILEDGASPYFMNARQLALAAEVSPATVVRFARRLGYDGFQSLKADLHDKARLQLGASQRVDQTVKALNKRHLLKDIFSQDVKLIEATLQLIDEKDFAKAVEKMQRARTLYILGEKSSFAPAYFLYFRLSRLGVNCKLVHFGGPAVFSQLSPLRKGDVLLAIGFRAIPYEVVAAVKRAMETKITTIAVTSPPASPISGMANICLFINRGSGEMLQSMTPALTLCHAIVVGVASKLGSRARRLLDEMDALENAMTSYTGSQDRLDR
jgi:DNA-binding MurR/RpiR family transcriptional regulator